MNRAEIMDKVTAIFHDIFNNEDIIISNNTSSTDIDDWDSISHITLIIEIEDTFDIRFSLKEVSSMKNVGEMLDILENRARGGSQ